MNKKVQKIFPYIIFIVLILSILISVTIGSVQIPLDHSISILLRQIGIPLEKLGTVSEETIILELRLPRVLMATVVGAMLGIAGVASQGLFRNPIADPYVLGISSSAGFGVALVALFEISFLGLFTVPVFSFIMSVVTVITIYILSQTKQNVSMSRLLLSGVALSYIFSALISFTLFIAPDKTHLILSILLGKFWGITWNELAITTAVMVPATFVLYIYGLDMNLMLFSNENAQSMGVDVKKTKIIILICMTLLASTAVSFCGAIGFVGLIIPHIVRNIMGSDNRKLIPLSAVAGGILLVWADVLARIIAPPLEIPVGVFTALMGGPFFIYLNIKKKKNEK